MAVDLFPSVGIDAADLARTDENDFAVFFMLALGPRDNVASYSRVPVGTIAGRNEFGNRNFISIR